MSLPALPERFRAGHPHIVPFPQCLQRGPVLLATLRLQQVLDDAFPDVVEHRGRR